MTKGKKREPVLWDCDINREHLTHTTIHEAVEYYLDDAAWVRPTLIVYGFAPMVPDPSEGSPLEDLLECLDETYADPDGGCTEATGRMRAAEAEFKRIVFDGYTPWACEKVCEESVDVRQWVKENHPGWLGEIEIRDKPAEPRREESP